MIPEVKMGPRDPKTSPESSSRDISGSTHFYSDAWKCVFCIFTKNCAIAQCFRKLILLRNGDLYNVAQMISRSVCSVFLRSIAQCLKKMILLRGYAVVLHNVAQMVSKSVCSVFLRSIA